jgi:predicted transcriptional regulator of viral defense system
MPSINNIPELNEKFNRITEYVSHKSKVSALIKTSELTALKLYSRDIASLFEQGYLEKVKHGCYRLAKSAEGKSEASLIASLYPDGVLCMYSALFYYGYSDRTPLNWDIAIDRNTSKARFNIDYPYVQPYYMEASHLAYGTTEATYEDCYMKILDRDRLICECIKNENKMDRETYNKAIQGYINDNSKCIPNLIDYAKKRNVSKKVKDRIGVWL